MMQYIFNVKKESINTLDLEGTIHFLPRLLKDAIIQNAIKLSVSANAVSMKDTIIQVNTKGGGR